jgi:chromosomal replication initiation ATPase DnaA
VELVQREIEARPHETDGRPLKVTLQQVMDLVCQSVGVRVDELRGDGRRAVVSQARAGVAYLWIQWLSGSGPMLAHTLGLHTATIYRVACRGRKEAARWEKLLEDF